MLSSRLPVLLPQGHPQRGGRCVTRMASVSCRGEGPPRVEHRLPGPVTIPGAAEWEEPRVKGLGERLCPLRGGSPCVYAQTSPGVTGVQVLEVRDSPGSPSWWVSTPVRAQVSWLVLSGTPGAWACRVVRKTGGAGRGRV